MSAPPGREAQVKALEQQPNVENPYAVAWSSYEGDALEVADEVFHYDVIERRGGSYVLLAKSTGKVLGRHKTRGEAEAQERAVQASKHADGSKFADAGAIIRQYSSRVRRYDYVSELAEVDLQPPEALANGWLKLDGKIARVGIQEYVDGEGRTIRELRLPEDVFDPESMRSFAMVPVTNTHPDKLLDATDARQHQVGSVGENIRPAGDWLCAPFMVTDAEAVAAIRAGRRQLSNGYECEVDKTQHPELVAKWGPYDGIQRRIRGNHLALVDRARAGAEASPRLDSADARVVRSESAQQPTPEKTNMEIRVDGHKIALTDANAGTIQSMIDRALADAKKAGEDLVAAERAKLDSVDKDRKKLTAKCDALKTLVLRGRKRADDAKAKMMACDACDGKGKIGDGDDAEMCDYCDGKGSFRMHEKIPESKLGPDHNEGAEAETDLDADELEVEQETENEAKKAHSDAKLAQVVKRRRDALQRVLEKRTRARVALEVAARRHLGADEKLDGKSDSDVKKLVISKLDGIDAKVLDGKSREYVDGRYDAAIGRADGGAPAAADLVRVGAIPMPKPGDKPAPRADGRGVQAARKRMLEHTANAHKAQAK